MGYIITPVRPLVLPTTPQTTSYITGDNASVQSGNSDVANRWTTAGNLVTDNHTGLQWVKNPAAIFPGDDTGAVVIVAKGEWDVAPEYVVGDLVAGIEGGAGNFYIATNPSGPLGNPMNPGNDEGWEQYWTQTVWTASAANLTTPASMTWENSLPAALALNYGGVAGWSAQNPTGWRIPTALELYSLVDMSQQGTTSRTTALTWIAGESNWTSNPMTSAGFALKFTGSQVAASATGATLLYPRLVRSLN